MTEHLDGPVLQPPALPVSRAADLQDHLLMAACDLERLQRLLADACASLIDQFQQVCEPCGHAWPDAKPATPPLAASVTALQFQDLAAQLIAHTHQRLRSCADGLALDLMADDARAKRGVTPTPERPNPVTQTGMAAGSIELF